MCIACRITKATDIWYVVLNWFSMATVVMRTRFSVMFIHMWCYPQVPEIPPTYRNLYSPHPLRSSHLWHLYSDPSGISMIGSTAGSHFASAPSSHPAIRSGSLQCWQNVSPWASILSSGIEKTTGGEVRRVGRMGDDCRHRRSQKLSHNERRVSRSVVAPLVWTFAPGVFPRSPQNVAMEFSIHRLPWSNKFLMHDAFNVEL